MTKYCAESAEPDCGSAYAASNQDADRILLLHPADVAGRRRTELHPGKTFSRGVEALTVSKQDFDRRHRWFLPSEHLVRNIGELHALLERIARTGDAIVVRAGLVAGHTARPIVRRKHVHNDGLGAPLRSVPLHALPLDLDGIPNVWHVDPTIDNQRARCCLMSLLPPALRRVTTHFAWSSSQSVQPGLCHELRARLWVWLDTPLGEADARALMKRLSRYVRGELMKLGKPGAAKVDHSLATCTQPIYSTRPKFEGGLCDPFPGFERLALIKGEIDVVCLAELNAELERLGPRVPAAAEAEPRRSGSQSPRDGHVCAGAVIPLSVARRELATRRQMEERHWARGRKPSGCRLFACRATLELMRVILNRRVLAEAGDPEWAAWVNGIPVGSRNNLFLILASLIAVGLSLRLSDEQVRREIRESGRLVVSPDWIAREWEGAGADGGVIGHFRMAREDATISSEGRDRDARYSYSMQRVVDEFGITAAEMYELRLVSLATDAIRLKHKRDDILRNSRERRSARVAQALQLADAGMSGKGIAAALGVGTATVSRWLRSRSPEARQAGREHAVPGRGEDRRLKSGRPDQRQARERHARQREVL